MSAITHQALRLTSIFIKSDKINVIFPAISMKIQTYDICKVGEAQGEHLQERSFFCCFLHKHQTDSER